MTNAMNYLRGWEGRADWRVFFVAQVQSWLVLAALMLPFYSMAYGWWPGYLVAVVLAVLAVPLVLTFCTQWRFDLHHYMRVVDKR